MTPGVKTVQLALRTMQIGLLSWNAACTGERADWRIPERNRLRLRGKEEPVTSICLVNATGSSALGTTAQRTQHDAEGERRRRRAILCVDDDPVVLYLQRVLLEAAGFAVTAMANSTDALRAFGIRVPDAVVLDYSMPGMSGAALAMQLRRLSRDVPLILNSACMTVPAADAVLFDRVLPKGLAASLLVRVLREMFPLSQHEQALPPTDVGRLRLFSGMAAPESAAVDGGG